MNQFFTWNTVLISILIALPFTAILGILLWWMEIHPISGKVIGKTKKDKLFILIIEDKRQNRYDIATNEETWNQAKLDDPFTTVKNRDVCQLR